MNMACKGPSTVGFLLILDTETPPFALGGAVACWAVSLKLGIEFGDVLVVLVCRGMASFERVLT